MYIIIINENDLSLISPNEKENNLSQNFKKTYNSRICLFKINK